MFCNWHLIHFVQFLTSFSTNIDSAIWIVTCMAKLQ
jgi:hypothetical protein